MSSSIQTLPVEVIHHILDDLDAQTILFSFRNTCRQLRAIVNTYDRYTLNFDSISKSDFELLCRLAEPSRVIALNLAQNAQTLDLITLFLSRFNLRQFSRLRSLTLHEIDEHQLKPILKGSELRLLNSFSLNIKRSDDRCKTTTARLISSMIASSNLSELTLHIQEGRLEKIVWPAQYSVQYLRIDSVVLFDQIFIILCGLSHLKRLILRSLSILNPHSPVLKSSFPTRFPQLTSLTFEKMNSEIDDLEKFLFLTPSLVHLKIVGSGNYCNGNRWEYLIQLHLPLLNKFEFVFNEIQNVQQNPLDINQIIASFQTPFWLEHKKWFVICEADVNKTRHITLYSIPICVSFLSYETKKTSISTFPKTTDMDISLMNHVDTIKFDFTKLSPLDMEKRENTANGPLFRKVKILELEFNTARPNGWIEFLSNLIDLTTITQVKVSSILIRKSNPYMLADMSKLLQQTCAISSVDICSGFFTRKSSLSAAEISSMIPVRVTHLAVSIKHLDEIKNILTRFQSLSSANFCFEYTPCRNELIRWFDKEKKYASYEADSFSVHVWLGKDYIQPKEIKAGFKRVKLADEHHQ